MKSRFSEYLKKYRMAKGITQSQMADQLKISRSTYANYESGNRAPGLETLEEIGDVLECSLDDLFGRKKYGEVLLREEKTPYQAVLDSMQGEKSESWSDRNQSHMEQSMAQAPGKGMGIGIDTFRQVQEWNGYYVDKTGMIDEFLNSYAKVTLITRPRRFGKTLNMSMLAEFLDCTKDSKDIFEGTKIRTMDTFRECNGHPVVSLSFLNVRGDSSEAFYVGMFYVLGREYGRYHNILRSEKLLAETREKVQELDNILLGKLPKNDENLAAVSQAIVTLCQALKEYYGQNVYLLIDEYDTPFIAANVGGYYAKVRAFLATLFSSALKGNDALEKAMLTGIQRVAKENIFSGLNNLSVCTVKDPEYAEYFGFTEEETKNLLEYFGLELNEDVKSMYDGYLFGTKEMYNPWSIAYYASRKKLEPYWVNTSENSMIIDAMDECSGDFKHDYNDLIEHGTTIVEVELESSFYEQSREDSLWGLLINAGMITVERHIRESRYMIRIPNKEVSKAFQKLTAHNLQINHSRMDDVAYGLACKDFRVFENGYRKLLLNLPSYYDLKSENSYYMMMLGLCSYLYGDYEVKSNRESGLGRSDIILRSRRNDSPSYVLEFKYTKDETTDLHELAKDAIVQIEEKHYDAELSGELFYIGLAHCSKHVEIEIQEA